MRNLHPIDKKIDSILNSWGAKILNKEKCECSVKIIQIVTGSYEYCRECGGVIRRLDF